MGRAVACCALSMALLAGAPAVAFADDADQDTLTEVVEVAVEGDSTIEDDSSAPPSDSSSADGPSSMTAPVQSNPTQGAPAKAAPATGDHMLIVIVACVAIAVPALVAMGVAARKAGAAGKK